MDYSLDSFIERTSDKERGNEFFELESEHMLQVNLKGEVWTKMGSMIAYDGNISFLREGLLESGFGKLLKTIVTGENIRLTKAKGNGKLFLADNGKRISIVKLQNQGICINGNDILAFEKTINWDVKMLKKISSMLAGGLFNIILNGSGMVAFTSHFQPMTLKVSRSQPIVTDPNATIAWSSNLVPEMKTDIQLKSFFGRGSGESFQMRFQGDGFVVVQPYEETYFQSR
jgi:uncharacterized protein (AIM24 family)